jgi:glycosyltransferase involved in cell wall biosynthesis
MKVLMFSSDASLLDAGSEAAQRHQAYASLLDRLHIVVGCRSRSRALVFERLTIDPSWGRWRPTRWCRMLLAGLSACKRDRPDVVSVQDAAYLGLAGAITAACCGLPLQVQVHEDILSPSYRHASPGAWIRYRMARMILPRAACIRAVSRRVADSIRADEGIPTDRLQVLPIYTDLQAVRTSTPLDDVDRRLARYGVKIVAAGRFIDETKGWSTLIAAFAGVLAQVPDAVLVLVGRGRERARYARMIRSLGVAESVRLEPWRKDLASFLKSFDIYVQPSNHEGWGRTYIEAAAAGLALITTDVGLVGEIFSPGEDTVVVPAGDRAALAEAMSTLCLNPELRSELSNNAMRALSRLPHQTSRDYVRAYVEGLQDCLSG